MTDWIVVCAFDDIEAEGVRRFDIEARTFAVYRSARDEVFCTDGLCSHEAVHLSGGLVMDYEIECPKHSTVFDIRTGEARRPPACMDLRTYPAKIEGGQIMIKI